MIDFRFKHMHFHQTGARFFDVICENGERVTLKNIAVARELFLGEVDRFLRRIINAAIRKAGYDIHTGERMIKDGNITSEHG